MRAHYGPTVSVPIGKSDTRLRDITIARTPREITASSPSQNADRTERTSNWDRQACLSDLVRKFAHVSGVRTQWPSAESRREVGLGSDDCVSSGAILRVAGSGASALWPEQWRWGKRPRDFSAPNG